MKKGFKFLFWLFPVLLLLVSVSVSGQDIHFTQYYQSPLTLNPALTGDVKGNWRLTGIYRNQWRAISTPLNTIAAGFDMPFDIKNNKLGAGVVVVNDHSGLGLNVSKLYVSGAFHLVMGKHTISFGIQPGLVNKRLSDGLTFPDQFNMEKGEFDAELATLDESMGDSKFYFDMNAGISWKTDLKKFHPQIGVSFFHITKPKISLNDNDQRQRTRFVVSAGGKIDIGKKFFLFPNTLFMYHSGAIDYLLGTNVGLNLPSNSLKMEAVYIGTLVRNGFEDTPNASTLIAGIQFRQLEISAAYDINISSLKEATNRRGAFEVAVIYIPKKARLDKIQIPCDRY